MRINAAKHFSAAFQKQFVDHLRNTVGADYFIVGEYWRGHVRHLLNYLKVMEYGVSLFDVPLLGRFAVTSKTEGSDLREIFRGTLVEQNPAHAVQLGQSLETVIAPFFKPIAYALILLRAQGQPCVFYGDLYGTKEGAGAASMPSCMGKLPVLMRARKLYAYGDQRDYFEKKNCIGKQVITASDSTH
ncbi:Alpha-amylase [Penicillium subrubescens]|uniref:Alpha-amylase n=1 Tax=Penicillium subrubescens TaxID=1316194 RepID=A0A1Q5SZ04_9EURO|nr:Alpha-amylase [Penicillium subrubescens]